MTFLYFALAVLIAFLAGRLYLHAWLGTFNTPFSCRMFGHNFEPVFNSTPIVDIQLAVCGNYSHNEIMDITRPFLKRTHVHDMCTKCGRRIHRRRGRHG